ncbi:MAG: hypothetical protein RSC93_08750 [Erysipelotrichaceae bacterium]
MKNNTYNCEMCKLQNLNKDIVGLNKKLFGEKITNFYCIDCLAELLEVTVEELNDKIEEFKEQGCIMFE